VQPGEIGLPLGLVIHLLVFDRARGVVREQRRVTYPM
jgi:hypothetical protein